LRTLPGLDVDQGLLRTVNKPALYTSMLRKFVAAHADAATRIQQCLDAGQTAAAELIAHTLKGVCGNLGALQLQASADLLESRLRNGASASNPDAVNLALADTRCLLQALVQALQQTPGLLPEHTVLTAESLSAAERQRAATVLGQVKAYLAHDDASALELWETHARILRPLHPRWQETEAALNAFEFDTALLLLSEPAP
jgi:two-component system sensor histidine kinase/response regulator